MDHFVCFREQLLHKLKLEEKEHEEKLSRERAAKVAELHVSAAVLCRKVTFFCASFIYANYASQAPVA